MFDDLNTIVGNPSIRSGWGVWDAVVGGTPTTVSSRPVAAATLAMNYRLGGLNPFGYHLVNIAIHALAALTLMGMARRTLLLPAVAWSARSALWASGAAALIWTVHPLNTSSVTYTVQRVESLMTLFYLLTLYCFARGCAGGRAWHVAAWVACLLGMGTKEVMVSAPVAVLLYDRVFVAGSWPRVLNRWRVHASLAATWFALAAILCSGSNRADSAGFHFTNLTWWDYLRMQPGALLTYFKLSFWPRPLVLDYGAAMGGVDVPSHWSGYGPQGLIILTLVGATAWLLWRRPIWGWAGVLFFMVLAPTSSFLPIVTEVIAEHRFYLPLAILITLVTTSVVAWTRREGGSEGRTLTVGAALVLGVPLLAHQTYRRNTDYQSPLKLWQDTVNQCPTNDRAMVNLSFELLRVQRYADAASVLGKAVEIRPKWTDLRYGLAMALVNSGHAGEAMEQFDILLKQDPGYVPALTGKGMTLCRLGRLAEAERAFTAAVAAAPENVMALSSLGLTRANLGDARGAVAPLRHALGLSPDHVDSLKRLAWIMSTNPDASLRDGRGAIVLADRACRLTDGTDSEALDALAAAFAETGQFPLALQAIEQAIAASRHHNNLLLDTILQHRDAFREGKPWRQ
ncbi:MAG: tetratricopeptide repeat protein [Planctomycetes bacterium]|nr:tetratricopeptide repeat protein [Planctomycetota bacterium]